MDDTILFSLPHLEEGEKNGVSPFFSPSPLGGGGKEWCDRPYLPNACLPPDTPFDRVKEGIGGDDVWPAAFFVPITWDFKK